MAEGADMCPSASQGLSNPTPQSEDISANLESIKRRTLAAYSRSSFFDGSREPRIVAVSKTKSAEVILSAFECGHKHFGENFVPELVAKATSPLLKGKDICWHFIGHLQRNKCNNLTAIPSLWAVETVDTERLATTLNTSWSKRDYGRRLRVFVQINTSGEASKHGCKESDVLTLIRHIVENCPDLEFRGLMTIGQPGYDYSTGPNPDFESLCKAREKVCTELGLSISSVELSMGMSSDFEEAILAGSTNIRVGSSIFGAREPKK